MNDPSGPGFDRRLLWLLVLGIFCLGLYGGLEQSGSRDAAPVSNRLWPHAPKMSEAAPSRPTGADHLFLANSASMGFEEFMRLFANLASDPAARDFAVTFAREPALQVIWDRFQHDHDVPGFLANLQKSSQFGRLLEIHSAKPGFSAAVESALSRHPELRETLRSTLAGARGSLAGPASPATVQRALGTRSSRPESRADDGAKTLREPINVPDARAAQAAETPESCVGVPKLDQLNSLGGTENDRASITDKLRAGATPASACEGAAYSETCARALACCRQEGACSNWLAKQIGTGESVGGGGGGARPAGSGSGATRKSPTETATGNGATASDTATGTGTKNILSCADGAACPAGMYCWGSGSSATCKACKARGQPCANFHECCSHQCYLPPGKNAGDTGGGPVCYRGDSIGSP